MAIVFQNTKYNLTIDSKMIIGVMGDYESFFSSLNGDIYYLDKSVSVSSKKVCSILDIDNKDITDLLKDFSLGEEFLNKKIVELSHSEQKILKYILMFLSNKRIIIIDEPFLDLDLCNKKKVILLLKRIVKDNKTIIIGSSNSNVIYQICKKVLLINNEGYYYGDINVFKDKNILKKYHVNVPDIVKFIDLVNEKNIKINYSRDIRDLIKDVYRNVSKKKN